MKKNSNPMINNKIDETVKHLVPENFILWLDKMFAENMFYNIQNHLVLK